MKILHIGDIHLGCTLENQRRNGEIEKVFVHLAGFVRKEKVKAALLAGDVFDKGSPSIESQELYYRFLLDLQQAGCNQVIVIAGNHDSSNFLDAPQALLKQMNIHIIGSISPDDPEKEVIALGSEAEPEAYVCAVPCLNERDVRLLSPEGENAGDRDAAIARGIEKHYRDVFRIADRKRNGRNIPVIGMGHLYAEGSSFATADGNRTSAGNLNAVDLSNCADGYAYMALGHLHKPQIVRGHENWRYAGSVLPMTLRENGSKPQVVLLDSTDPEHPVTHELPQECFHEMEVIRGDFEELRAKLSERDAAGRDIWVKVIYTGSEIRPNWSMDLRQEFRDRNVRLLVTEVQRESPEKSASGNMPETEKPLSAMTPEEVFLDCLNREGEVTDPDQLKTYLALFRQSMNKVCDPTAQTEKKSASVKRGIMKFERLYIKNVNSLYGENLIDFTGPEFRDGIFLISGNTGAGKSSIFDAICLALYGETPRVSSISVQKDCIMSEGTHEMQAELTFTLDGSRYRACFFHRRTKQAEKPFCPVVRLLYKNDVQIPGNATAIKEEIRNMIGMTKEQFCRCVLLAQGSFDAFLKAGPQDRSCILKSITGTEIYTEIGKQINADFSEAKNQYELARQALDGITLLSSEEQQKLQENKAAAEQKKQSSADELKKHEWIETVFQAADQANTELRKAAEQAAAAEKNRLLAAPRRQELEDANRALNCETSFLQRRNIQKQQKELQDIADELKQQQPLLEKNACGLEKDRAELERRLNVLLEQQKKDQELFRFIRILDSQIAGSLAQYGTAVKERDEACANLQKCQKKFSAAEKKWAEDQRKAGAAQNYCASHAADKDLAQLKITWELRRKQLCDDEKRNAAEKRKLQTRQTGLTGKKQLLDQSRKDLQSLQQKKKAAENALAALAQEMDSLLLGKSLQALRENWAAAVKLDELFKDSAQRREYLTPEQPCPLCGSVQHPYCEGTPVPDCREFENAANALAAKIKKIDSCRKKISKAELEKGNAEAEIAARGTHIAELESSINTEELAVKEQGTSLETLCRETAEKATALAADLQQAIQVQWSDFSVLPAELDARIAQYGRMQKILESLAADRAEYEKAGSVFAAMKPQLEEIRDQKQNVAAQIAGKLEDQQRERADKFGTGNVDEAEKKIAAEMDSCRAAVKAAAEATIMAREKIAHNQKDLQLNQKRLAQFNAELQQAETQFAADLRQYGFPSEADFAAKRRDAQYIQDLTAGLREIDNALNIARGALAERQKMLDDTRTKLPENADRAANLEQTAQLRQTCEDLQKEINALAMQLDQAEDARKKYEENGKKAAALNMEFNNWKFLDDHFGSAGADRFGRIAQGYTFSELLHFANNNRLSSLQNHFTLVNDDKDPLELNVIDHYRGGLIRTAKNLSGGECFEVSLALALGLAEMSAVSQNASLGNVLLDEGFGTLDDDSLESALELLMQLRKTDRKLVGIISHVARLKDRIATQIEVSSSGGMGSLSGAGVVKVRHAAEESAPKKSAGKPRPPKTEA